MEAENKLDQDFLFYLGFTGHCNQKLTDCGEKQLVQQWLERLCGERFQSVDAKKNRNIFLSNLILTIHDGKLNEPFTVIPDEVDLNDARRWFSSVQDHVETPGWLDEVVNVDSEDEANQPRQDGRTYVATRAMPNGTGAFAYVAVSLAEEEPRWLGGGEGVFDQAMERKFREVCPVPHEMEQVLARRRDAKERQRVLAFYDVMLQNIADELDEKITEENNATITIVLNQLIDDLKNKGQYGQYEELCGKNKRMELLLLLFDRTKARRDLVMKREEVLDEISSTFKESFFQNSGLEEDDKYELPSQMWEYAINRPPNKAHMDRMQAMYPPVVLEKFMNLLSNQKEEIAIRMQRRHVNIVSQMKKELRKEGEKLKRTLESNKVSCEQAMDVLLEVQKAEQKMRESYEAQASRKKGGETEKTKLYQEMRATLFDTQIIVEEEASRGRVLTEQINVLNAQTEVYNQVTECSILKTEETNMEIMKNIKRLHAAITLYESRLKQIEVMKECTAKSKSRMMIM